MLESKKKNKPKIIAPLNDEEVRVKMKYFENLISELEWRRTRVVKPDGDDERSRVYRETRSAIKKISSHYVRREELMAKDTLMFESRVAGAARLKLLQEKDKNVTDVVLAVHRRLGRVDHSAHKKAYRRILYALVVQGLCRLLDVDVILVFRESDIKLGRAIINRSKQKYKEITGIDVQLTISTTRYLPFESCGGVDIYSVDGRHVVNNSLAVRLDQLLQKACPMIRIALYGLNDNRVFFDLSKMSGSPTLFDFPDTILPSDDDTSSSDNHVEVDHDIMMFYKEYNHCSTSQTSNKYNTMATELTV